MSEFLEFPKMARLSREVIITEKIDGTNAQIFISDIKLEPTYTGIMYDTGDYTNDPNIIAIKDGYTMRAGSRNKWITPGKQDNAGFAGWVRDNHQELFKLGEGRHFGEWWGLGIQRGYNMKEKVFSLFNVDRWGSEEVRPSCCRVIPELWRGIFDTRQADIALEFLKEFGSVASPLFMNPEGIIVWHVMGNVGFKKTLDKNDAHKG